ncbi:MAG: alpha/beta fold hydrolase [Sphaerobacter sp.]|nr:alpha/beta fold hydrolase [Sphaerobacter sp.]
MITPQFWLANRITPRSLDLAFRLTSAAILSPAGRLRYIHGGIGARQLDATLRRARGIRGWTLSWVQTAREYLAAARRARQAGDRHAAARFQASAALCFHYAQVFDLGDVARRRHLYHRAAELFRPVAPSLQPSAIPVEIPWRDVALPGYLRLPDSPPRPYPLVVVLNGATTVKEETIRWAEPFLRRGFATLALDTPGSGEAWERMRGHPSQVDIGAALIAFAAAQPDLDARRVALLGISLGGAMAVRIAAATPEIAATVSVTAPFHPPPYFHHLNAVVRHEMAHVSGAADAELDALVERISLVDVAPRLRTPLLVIGAGRDLVIPPQEAWNLYRAAGGPKHCVFIEDANHVGFSHMSEWRAAAADWLAQALGR